MVYKVVIIVFNLNLRRHRHVCMHDSARWLASPECYRAPSGAAVRAHAHGGNNFAVTGKRVLLHAHTVSLALGRSGVVEHKLAE